MKKLYTALVLTLFVLPLVAQTIPSYVPKDGLVGYWPFNGNANDESGNGNHGTVNGASLTADRNGVANSAYSFDGKNNFIEVPHNDIFNLNDSLTISVWYKTIYLNLAQRLVDKITINTADGWLIDHRPTNHIRLIKAYEWSESNSNVTSYDTWINITVTWNGDKVSFYKNGKLFSENNSVGKIPSNNLSVRFGGSSDGLSELLKGQLDDIAIYNRALSDQEIKQLYEGCSKETATSSSFNSLLLSTGSSVSISAEPQGGVFSGESIENNQFIPSKAKIGSNKVKYNFKNSKGCVDSTVFNMVVADTVGASCTKYDTVTVTNNVTKYDTITVTNNVTKYDTVTVNKYDTLKVTKFDTVTVKNNVYDTVTITNNVTKYDTVTFTNNVTKYDTVIVKTNVFDTVKVTKYDTLNVTKYDTVIVNKTKYDTVIVKTNVFDTVKVTKYDTLKVTKFDTVTITNNVTKYDTVTVTNNITKYDTVIVKTNVFDTVKVTKYDTLTVTNNVTKYDTVKVTKYDTLTVKNNIYDTVSILKIKFKLTTGIHANQLSSLSIYPNPTSDVLHIEVPDAKALEGYRYRILDALGKEVYNQLVTQSTNEIPLKTLGAAGIYQFEILDATKTSIQSNKIVLQ